MIHKHKVSSAVTALSALVVLLALAYSAPGYFARKQADIAPDVKAFNEDVINAFRAERASVRELEILQLNAVAADERADVQVRAAASGQLLRLTDYMEKETTLEGVLRLRGFADAVVTVHEASVNVLVRADALSQSESAFILDLVMRETGQSGGNVKIMTVLNSGG